MTVQRGPHSGPAAFPTAGPLWRLFALQRDDDPTGMSGTGVIAYGEQLPDGRVLLRWVGPTPSTVVWTSVDDLVHIHSHAGRSRTYVRWLDETGDEAEQAGAALEAAWADIDAITRYAP